MDIFSLAYFSPYLKHSFTGCLENLTSYIFDLYSHGHFWFVKNQFFWNFCFSVKDAEKFIKHHLFIYKRFTADQNFKGVTQKLRLPRPWQVQNWPNYTMPFYYVKVPKWKKWVDPSSFWSKTSIHTRNQVASSKTVNFNIKWALTKQKCP